MQKKDDASFGFRGTKEELKAQYDFLKTMAGYVSFSLSIDEGGVPVLSGTLEQMHRALGSIWQHKVAGWWNYRECLVSLGYCTEEEYWDTLLRG